MKVFSKVSGLLFLASLAAVAEPPTPGFNNPIPSEILTPDTVDTSIGTLNFFDGMPDDETVAKVYDNLDTIRSTEAFLNFIPAASMEGLRIGLESIGASRATPSHDVRSIVGF